MEEGLSWASFWPEMLSQLQLVHSMLPSALFLSLFLGVAIPRGSLVRATYEAGAEKVQGRCSFGHPSHTSTELALGEHRLLGRVLITMATISQGQNGERGADKPSHQHLGAPS